jgi:hypothetical protein
MPSGDNAMDSQLPSDPDAGKHAGAERLSDALEYITDAVENDSIATGAAKGLLYSVMETLGTVIGDPDLPAHVRSGYEGLLEKARELRARLDLDA